MIEPRIYRAAFFPALLALVLVAFSLQTAPRAVPQGLAADALFEGVGAVSMVQDIVATTPDRRAGHTGDAAYRDPRTIDVHIRHLREKIERDAKEPELIFTVRGVGYHFRDR